MTKRFARAYQWMHARLGGRRKLVLAIIALWIAAELVALAVVAITGKQWLDSRAPGADAVGVAARSGPSLSLSWTALP